MTVHGAKGLEFDVVAVADLGREPARRRSPAAALVAREPSVAAGEPPPRVGMQLRAARDARSTSRLRRAGRGGRRARGGGGPAPLPRRRHPGARAADPQRPLQRRPTAKPEEEMRPSTPVTERLMRALDIEPDGERRGSSSSPRPAPRPGARRSFGPGGSRSRSTGPIPATFNALRSSREPGEEPPGRTLAPPPLADRPRRAPSRPRVTSPTRRSRPMAAAATASSPSAWWAFAAQEDRGTRRRAEPPRGTGSGSATPFTRCSSGALGTAGASQTRRSASRCFGERSPRPARRRWSGPERWSAAGSSPSCAPSSATRGSGAARDAVHPAPRRLGGPRHDRPLLTGRGAAGGRLQDRRGRIAGPRRGGRPIRGAAPDLRARRRAGGARACARPTCSSSAPTSRSSSRSTARR